MSGISAMRRFRVALNTFVVVVRLPEDLDEPAMVDVRTNGEDGEFRIGKVAWRREYTDEQRSGARWVDELRPLAAAELILAALGGAASERVSVVEAIALDDRLDAARRILAVVIAQATTDAAVLGDEALLSGVVYDLSGRRE